MPDSELINLTALTTPAGEDLLYAVDDPSGTPLDRKLTLTSLISLIEQTLIRYVEIEVFDFQTPTDIETGDGKAYFHVPADLDGYNLVEIHGEVKTAPTGSAILVQVHNVDNVLDMLTNRIQIDAGETGSDTAATAPSINTSNDHVNENDMIRIDVDQVGSSTPGSGLIVTLGFRKP